jgi:fluoride exporter
VALSTAFPTTPGELPWSTLAENLSGAFLLAWLLTAVAERARTTWVRPLLGTGLLGAYTTFATVGLELHLLTDAGRPAVAVAYLAAIWAGGLLAGGLGFAAGRGRARGSR